MSSHHETAIPEISDSISVISSTAGGKVFRDIFISAYMGDESDEKFFKAKLDTGADFCLISEHIVENKWGTERIDATKSRLLNGVGMHDIRTMGQIRITIQLRPGIKRVDVPFQVLSNTFVAYRFDALLSDRVIGRRGILVWGPDFRDEETDSEDDE
jgi:Retroviral aspartyl protease